ncbi:MAG: hypothetical protein EBX67_12900, partial [Betaproteobacteria bacterium]|nr:hypothetical protein [Betaproteobacteria bacterium]
QEGKTSFRFRRSQDCNRQDMWVPMQNHTNIHNYNHNRILLSPRKDMYGNIFHMDRILDQNHHR